MSGCQTCGGGMGKHDEGGLGSGPRYPDRPTAQDLSDLNAVVNAASRQVAEMSKARVRYLAALLADTRSDDGDTEGEWAIRLWEAGVRPPLPTPRGFTNWGEE